jgi:hypothetical protein
MRWLPYILLLIAFSAQADTPLRYRYNNLPLYVPSAAPGNPSAFVLLFP